MAKQQAKRRRKRYEPGSAYAGDVRPTGIIGFMSSGVMVRVVFIGMALALAVGGGVAIFGTGVLTGTTSDSNPAGFVVPEDEDASDATGPDDDVDLTQFAAPPDMTIDPDKRYVATIRTELGDIQVELLAAQAPVTVNNFVFLARYGFYDGLIFHYAQESFSANAGDPACTATSESCRGTGGPGYELTEDAAGDFQKGTLGMTNASQFLIALTESEQQLGQFEGFTPFGQVVSGLDVAEQVTRGTEIQTIEILEE